MTDRQDDVAPQDDFEDQLTRRAQGLDESDGRQILSGQLTEYYYITSIEKFVSTRTNVILGADGVDAEIGRQFWQHNDDGRAIKPSTWLREHTNNQVMNSISWFPGEPQIVYGKVATVDGIIDAPGQASYNTCVMPDLGKLNTDQNPDRIIDHIRMMFPDEPEGIKCLFDILAFKVQNPGKKCNIHVVLSGKQGIGKDLMLYSFRRYFGNQNVKEIDPDVLFTPYTPHWQSIIAVVNEARTTAKEHHAQQMYSSLKPVTDGGVEVIPIKDKYEKTRYIPNVVEIFITTNEAHALSFPPDDRRWLIMHSDMKSATERTDKENQYYQDLWDWLREQGGWEAFIIWLSKRDLSKFNPAATAPMTKAKQYLIDNAMQKGQTYAEGFMQDFIELVYNGEVPEAFFLQDLVEYEKWKSERPHKSIKYCGDLLMVVNKWGVRTVRREKNLSGRYPVWQNSKGTFRSSIAFVRNDVDDFEAVIHKALARRPITFGSETALEAERKGLSVHEGGKQSPRGNSGDSGKF